MKAKAKFTLFLAMAMLTALSLSAQKLEDMAGTWVGKVTAAGENDNEFTLVLELKNGKLAGKMSDQFGAMKETPVEDISLEKGVFSFSGNVQVHGGGAVKFKFKMNVAGDSMEGQLLIPDKGWTATWKATKQK